MTARGRGRGRLVSTMDHLNDDERLALANAVASARLERQESVDGHDAPWRLSSSRAVWMPKRPSVWSSKRPWARSDDSPKRRQYAWRGHHEGHG